MTDTKSTDEERYIFEELAGKLEYDAGLSRAEAEKMAKEQLKNTRGGKHEQV